MFQKAIGELLPEISHKRIDAPTESVYFNHIHNHAELLLFISGEADYNIDGQVFRPSPYDLLLVPAATYHYLIPTSRAPYENYVIGLSPDLLDTKHYEKLFSPPLMLRVKDDEELIGFFRRLDLYAAAYQDADFSLCAESLVRELLTYCSYRKDELRSVSNATLTHVDGIVGYISENLEKPLDADCIARHLHLSKSYVQNLFNRTMHIGLKKYIMQKKIYAAHADLTRGLSPLEACEKYGFGDYSSFYRLYKKTFSAPPRSVR